MEIHMNWQLVDVVLHVVVVALLGGLSALCSARITAIKLAQWRKFDFFDSEALRDLWSLVAGVIGLCAGGCAGGFGLSIGLLYVFAQIVITPAVVFLCWALFFVCSGLVNFGICLVNRLEKLLQC
jgi:hypothetical protein